MINLKIRDHHFSHLLALQMLMLILATKTPTIQKQIPGNIGIAGGIPGIPGIAGNGGIIPGIIGIPGIGTGTIVVAIVTSVFFFLASSSSSSSSSPASLSIKYVRIC